MKIKVVIDGADGMEDAARRIADLLDAVERAREENREKAFKKRNQKFSEQRYWADKIKMLAREVAGDVFKEMKEKESKEKSPAEEAREIKANIDKLRNIKEAIVKSRNDGDAADRVVENVQQG